MNCRKARIYISAELDDELRPAELNALNSHLTSCPACREERAEVAAFSAAMRGWGDEEPSQWLAPAFAHKLADLQSPAPRRSFRWAYGTALAAVVAALAFVAFEYYDKPAVDSHMVVNPPSPSVSEPMRAEPLPDPAPESQVAANPQGEAGPAVATPESAPPAPAVRRNETPLRRTFNASNPNRRLDYSRRSRYVHLASREAPRTSTPEPPAVETDVPGAREDAAMVMIASMLDVRDTGGEAAARVTADLGEASSTMGETLESVRGALMQAADLMAAVPADGSI